jgi:hypothetical protein
MTGRLSAMISSTARDLPAHRKEVSEACLRQGIFPLMMEHLPASDAEAIAVSLRMVDEAGLYLGVIAHRYGYVPAGHRRSLTEMEYDRAVERQRPRLIFLMHDDHPVRAAEVEKGEGASRLEAFKERLKAERVVSFFKSPEDLRGQVIDGLSRHRPRDLSSFHRAGDVPAPPEPYIAHPYTLLQTRSLVGREAELRLLDDWVSREVASSFAARVFNLVAIGGMGKSALTWAWFNDRAPEVMRSLAGRLWWSFYESDATFENFIISALAYVAGEDREAVRELPPSEFEARLLAALDRQPFLLVLDGLERILIAYARMDAARLADDDLDRQTANAVVEAAGTPAREGRPQLRKTTDPRAGAFLRKLTRVRASRVLVSSRLYPADLQAITGATLPGSHAHFLTGLTDADAVGLWTALGVSGSRSALLELFHRFGNYPLLIRALAGEVARYRRAPGDFDRWRHDHPDFDPARLPLVQVRSHVLAFALGGLSESERRVLHTTAAFRMPATYDTLAALLVGEGKCFAGEQGLDSTLTELEDRGLLGWDRQANRYDLHPVVRGVAWEGLAQEDRRGIYDRLRSHFEAFPAPTDTDVRSLDDLTPSIELYNSLVELECYEDAFALFRQSLQRETMFRLSANRERSQLLERLFPAGTAAPPALRSSSARRQVMNMLALSYQFLGRLGEAVRLLRCAAAAEGLAKLESNLSEALRFCGALRHSEAAARRAIVFCRQQGLSHTEVIALVFLGMTQAARGIRDDTATFQRAWWLDERDGGGVLHWLSIRSADRALWLGDFAQAQALADRAWALVADRGYEAHIIEAARLQGTAALFLGGPANFVLAAERLQHALARVRRYTMVQEELPTLTALAELYRVQGETARAREFLEDVWEPVERGPYPLFHADALNVLAQVERDAGNRDAAVEAATRAYRLAWCDGPPYAYHWGLEAARAHLVALGAPVPDLPAYDESRHEPMLAVEIDSPEAPQ